MTDPELMSPIRSGLRAAADPARAVGAQANLKPEMPSLGVRVPEVRRIVTAAAVELPPGSLPELQPTVLKLWRGCHFPKSSAGIVQSRLHRMSEVRRYPAHPV